MYTYAKPPIDITVRDSNSQISNVSKLVSLTDNDYELDDGIYKRKWTVTFMSLDFENNPNDYIVYDTQYIIDGYTPSITSPSRYGWVFDYWMLDNVETNISNAMVHIYL